LPLNAGIAEPAARGHTGNLGLLFAAHARSERTAITDLHDPARPREVSFRELDALCNAVARGLARAGLVAGDRIAILSLNRIEFVATVLGCMRAGVVPVPVNIKLPADAVAYIVKDAGAKLIFTESPLRRLCPTDSTIVEYGSATGFDAFIDHGEFTAIDAAIDRLTPGDLCLILIDQIEEALAHITRRVEENRSALSEH
jgi:acyl-CoA synthetase (AMP-forming)/AMP-acid ligase II